MGFGHRVYKWSDPRARIIKTTAIPCSRSPAATRCSTSRSNSNGLHSRTSTRWAASSTRMWTSIPGLIYQAMGFPVDMFPVLFAIPRTAGWLAQWDEMLRDPDQKIARPRQIYIGAELARFRANHRTQVNRARNPHETSGLARARARGARGRVLSGNRPPPLPAPADPGGRQPVALRRRQGLEHLRQIVAIGPRPAGSPTLRQTRAYITHQLASYGLVVEEQPFTAETPLGRARWEPDRHAARHAS